VPDKGASPGVDVFLVLHSASVPGYRRASKTQEPAGGGRLPAPTGGGCTWRAQAPGLPRRGRSGGRASALLVGRRTSGWPAAGLRGAHRGRARRRHLTPLLAD
jgi:hypothetical protein